MLPARHFGPWVALAVVALLPRSGAGSTHEEVLEITFDRAIGLAATAPHTQGTRRELEARRLTDEGIGGTLGPTELILMPGALVSPESERAFDLQTSLTQGWSLGGLGGARRDAAAAERELLQARIRAEALAARLDAARSWVELATQERLVTLWSQSRDDAEAWLAHAERALEVAQGTRADLAEARAAAAEWSELFLAADGARFVARNQLALHTGHDPTGAALSARGPLPNPALPSAQQIQVILQALEDYPPLVVARLEKAVARAREAEAAAGAAPMLTLGAQVERPASAEWVTYGIAGLTWSFTDWGERERSVHEGEAARAEGQLAARLARARAELEEATHEVEHAAARLEVRAQRTVPALENLVAYYTRAVELREAVVSELYRARRRLQDARAGLIEAEGEHAWAKVRLWLLLAQLEDA